MNHAEFIEKIDENVRNAYENGLIDGTVTTTTINNNETGYFVSVFDGESDDEIKNIYFDDNVSRQLDRMVEKARSDFNCENTNDYNISIRYSRRDKNKLYIVVGVIIEDTERTIKDFNQKFTKSDSSTHNVTEESITKLIIRYDSIWDSFDSTCYYNTENPHEVYSNIDSLEEYAERMSENTDRSRDDILNQETYTSHYHPMDYEILRDVKQEFETNLSMINASNSSRVDVTKLEISADKSVCHLSAQYESENIYNN